MVCEFASVMYSVHINYNTSISTAQVMSMSLDCWSDKLESPVDVVLYTVVLRHPLTKSAGEGGGIF